VTQLNGLHITIRDEKRQYSHSGGKPHTTTHLAATHTGGRPFSFHNNASIACLSPPESPRRGTQRTSMGSSARGFPEGTKKGAA
jgi:hypothetical protein